MKTLIRLAEPALTALFLLLYTGGPITVLIVGGANEEDGIIVEDLDNYLTYILFLLNYALSLFILVVRWKKVAYVLSKDRFIWVLVGLAIVSIFWSSAPEKTLSRAIALIGTSLFGLYLATRYTPKQQLELLGWAFGLSIVLSVLFVVALPQYGLMGGLHSGAWRGIYTHKNVLGKIMVLSSAVFLLLASGAKKHRWLLWFGFSLSLALIFLSTSSSSLGNFITITAAFFVCQSLRWRFDRLVPAALAIATASAILYIGISVAADVLLGSLGKDATLTGRTDLWPCVLDMIWKRPWLGYGYSGFWRGLNGPSAIIWYATGWQPPDAHNGLLDLWLSLGLLGVCLYLMGFFINLVKGLARVRLTRTAEGFWPFILMIFQVLVNLTESSLMVRNDICWVLYVAAVLSMLLPPEPESVCISLSFKSEQTAIRLT